jgi:hypothetical protein
VLINDFFAKVYLYLKRWYMVYALPQSLTLFAYETDNAIKYLSTVAFNPDLICQKW